MNDMTATYAVQSTTTNNTTMIRNETPAPILSPPPMTPSTPPLLVSSSLPLKATTKAATHHDIIISLTSPALVKKKKSYCSNDTTKAVEFVKPNYINSSFLTPAAMQLLRNSLLLSTTATTAAGNIGKTSSVSPNSATTTASKSTIGTGTVANNHQNHREQQQQQPNRKFKRLHTEPIPIARRTTTNNAGIDKDICSSNGAAASKSATIKINSSSSCRNRRRQIFNSFWDTTLLSTQPETTPHEGCRTTTSTTRSNSCCDILVNGAESLSAISSSTAAASNMIRMKPSSVRFRSISEDYRYSNYCNDCDMCRIVNGTSNGYQYQNRRPLPVLPSPMQRLQKSSGGVYPLVRPKSILRRKTNTNSTSISRMNNDTTNVTTGEPQIGENGNATTNSSGVIEKNMNCSTTGRSSHCKGADEDGSTTTVTTISDFDRSSSICSSNNSIHSISNDATISITRRPMVHFDPRITITELVGRDHDRIWYSDKELNRFKYETIVVARTYFQDHPDEIVYYNQPKYDPITKTMRKRALFSMPALCNITITEEDDDPSNDPTFTTSSALAKDTTTNTNYSATSTNNQDRESLAYENQKLPVGYDNKTEQEHQRHLLALLAFEDDDSVISRCCCLPNNAGTRSISHNES